MCELIKFLIRWWSGVVVSALGSIYQVNPRRARLVLRWVTVSRFSSRCWTFISACNQTPKANSAFHLSRVGKWVPALAGKAKAGMVYSISGWMRGVQVKLWDPVRMLAIPECLRGVFMMRCYTNPRLPYLTLYDYYQCHCCHHQHHRHHHPHHHHLSSSLASTASVQQLISIFFG